MLDFDELDGLEEEEGEQASDDEPPPASLPVAKHTRPSSLNLQEARAAQGQLIREFTRPAFQDRLHALAGGGAAAAGGAEDGDTDAAAARKDLVLSAQIRVARAQGFEASAEGVAIMHSALSLYVGSDPESAHREALIRWLLDPELQRTELVPKGPARCTLFSTAHIYTAQVPHVCRLEVHINDTIRNLKENIYLSTRKSWMMQKLYVGETELLDQVPLSSLMRVGATTSFRLEYRQAHVVQWLERLKDRGASCLQDAPAELLVDREFMLPALQISAQVLKCAAPSLRADRSFLLQIAPHCGQALRFAAPELRADREVVLAAVRQDPWTLELAAPELRSDREVVFEAVKRDSWALQFAMPDLRQDEELVLLATQKDPTIILGVLPELQKDRRAVLKAVQMDWNILASLGPEMASDREVLLAAVRQSGWALQHVPKERLSDRDIVLEAVKNHGDALRFADPELLNDHEIMFAAVRQSGTALGLATPDMQDLEMAIAAVRVDKRALVFVTRRLVPDVLKWLGLDRLPDWAKQHGGAAEADDEDAEAEEDSSPFSRQANIARHFAVLELPTTASKEEIRKKYHQLALQLHPDKYVGEADDGKRKFQRLQVAYEALQEALRF